MKQSDGTPGGKIFKVRMFLEQKVRLVCAAKEFIILGILATFYYKSVRKKQHIMDLNFGYKELFLLC